MRGGAQRASSTGRDACPTLDSLRCAQVTEFAHARGAAYISLPETGRAEPSRQTLVTLVNLLDIPLRERNFLLLAEESAIMKLS
jgi:hypothetical protein